MEILIAIASLSAAIINLTTAIVNYRLAKHLKGE